MDIPVSSETVKDVMTTPTPPEGGKLLDSIVHFAERKRPSTYTIHISHHFDGRLEFWFEDVADDDRSRTAIADALEIGVKLLRKATKQDHQWRTPVAGEPMEEGGICAVCGAYFNTKSKANLPCPIDLDKINDERTRAAP